MTYKPESFQHSCTFEIGIYKIIDFYKIIVETLIVPKVPYTTRKWFLSVTIKTLKNVLESLSN